jgi:hypothetical protein
VSLPDEDRALADLRQQLRDIFDRAERAHNAAVEMITRGRLKISQTEHFNRGAVTVTASLFTKACKTFRAIQFVAEGGLGQDAAVLARSLFETTVAMLFVMSGDRRKHAAMFAAHEDQRLLVLLEDAAKKPGLQHVGTAENVAKATAKVEAWHEILAPDVVASVRWHWSGEKLEAAASKVGMAEGYTMMYRSTSSFAHVSDVTAHFFVKREADVPTLKLAPWDDQVLRVLSSAIDLLRILASAFNDGWGLGEEEAVRRIAAEVPLHNGRNEE